MKFIIPTILALASASAAANCKVGLNYCGWNLLKKGNYKDTIVAELNRVGVPADANHIYNDLYHCKDGQGLIYYQKQCSGDNSCQDGGSGKNDYC